MAETQPDHEGSWRCASDINKFCPVEGCLAAHGCARERGWEPSQPSPFVRCFQCGYIQPPIDRNALARVLFDRFHPGASIRGLILSEQPLYEQAKYLASADFVIEAVNHFGEPT